MQKNFLGLGGFHALAALVAIKFKIIVIGIFVFGAIFYGIRIWAGKGIGCPEPSIVKEPFYPHGITAYSPHTSSDIYSSYPGISSSSGVYLSHPPSGADVYPSTGYSSYPGAVSGDVPAEVLAESHYKRKGRSLDGEDNEARATSNGIDVAEIMFGFLNVRTLDCKRRFVCEVDFISKRDPWIRMGYNLMGEGIFKKYRTNDSVNVKKYRECLKLFESCKTPHEEEAHKVGYVETTSTNSTKKASLRRRNRRKQITQSFFF
uniref:CSON015282 protein n=1 Tax=Culicoides sonorensis TaxID=179676 RepID=A0A336MIJ9_CULSO